MIRAILAILLLAAPASAALTQAELRQVGVFPPPGAALPANLAMTGLDGRRHSLASAMQGKPTVVVFTDYSCQTLCGPILRMASAALAQSGLRPHRDFRLLVIGLDPKDNAATARDFVAPQIDPSILPATHIFLGDHNDTARAAAALGYRYRYDAENDQFAHPTTAFVLDGDGRMSAALGAIGLDGGNLRLALVAAGQGKIGTLADQVHLLCYSYDPATGLYAPLIGRLLDAAAIATLLALGGGIFWLRRRERQKAGP